MVSLLLTGIEGIAMVLAFLFLKWFLALADHRNMLSCTVASLLKLPAILSELLGFPNLELSGIFESELMRHNLVRGILWPRTHSLWS